MNVWRITNRYFTGRNIYTEYFICSSLYKIDYNAISRLRTLPMSKDGIITNEFKNEKIKHKIDYRMIQSAPSEKFNLADLPKEVLTIFKTIRMKDISLAPEPVFWFSTAALLPFVGVPLSFLIFGYSPLLATMHLTYAATLCSFAGGMKWGYALQSTEHQPTWENLGWSIVPQLLGWFSLILPQILGYILVTGAIALSTYIDLKATNYPVWFKSIRVAVAIPAIFCLLIAFLIRIFH